MQGEAPSDPVWRGRPCDEEAKMSDHAAVLTLSSEGPMGDARVRLVKTYSLNDRGADFQVDYDIEVLDGRLDVTFGVEWNFSMLAGRAHDRYYITDQCDNAGHLSTVVTWPETRMAGVVDEWSGVRVTLDTQLAADVHAFPIETVSQSESGFERVYQSSVVILTWPLALGPGDRWKNAIRAEAGQP